MVHFTELQIKYFKLVTHGKQEHPHILMVVCE